MANLMSLHRGDSFVSARKSSRPTFRNGFRHEKSLLQPGQQFGGREYERGAKRRTSFFLRRSPPKIALVRIRPGRFRDEFADAAKIPYAKIPHFPQSTPLAMRGTGHRKSGAIPLAGSRAASIFMKLFRERGGFPIRVFARMGVKAVISQARRHQTGIRAGPASVIKRSHQFAGRQSSDRTNDERFGLRFTT